MDEALFYALNAVYRYAPPTWDFLGGNLAAGALAVVAVGLMLARGQARWLLAAGLAVAITDPLCARVLKPIAARERPCAVLPAVSGPRLSADGPVHCGTGASMPSNHAANAAALASALASPPLAGVAAVVGVSRVVNGQHWPTDVLAGWLVGGVVGSLVRLGVARALNWR